MRNFAACLGIWAALLGRAPALANWTGICPEGAARLNFALPHTSAAVAANQPVVVVALGSSSTRGWMSSGIGYAYPSVLQRLLSDAMPFADFAVVNRGIGGQDALAEVGRLDQDVLALRPQLVIWQTGANDALHGVTPEQFRKTVDEGVARLQQRGADVILMDNQHSPRIDANADAARLNQVLAQVAIRAEVNLFSRASLMQEWAEAGDPLSDFVAHDGLHMNDAGYACTARALAQSIVTALPSHTTRHYPP